MILYIRRAIRKCYISNPWTRECVRLPNIFVRFPLHCGLAFECEHWQVDSNNNNNSAASYKVVILNKIEAELNAFIYSSETQSWRVLCEIFMPWRSQDIASGNVVYCNRILHWRCGVTCALLFYVEKESFDLLDLPTISSSSQSNVDSPTNPSRSWFEKNCPTGRLTECHGQLHYLLIGFNLQLNIWNILITSKGCYDGWVKLRTVDLKLPMKTSMLFFQAVEEEKENFPYLNL